MQMSDKLSGPASWPKELQNFIDTSLRTLSLDVDYAHAESLASSY